VDDLVDTVETKWASLRPVEREFFVVRYDYLRLLIKKKIAALNAKKEQPKPRATAADKRSEAANLAEAKRRERGELLLTLASEFGAEHVESVIARLDINWYTFSDKWPRIVRMILKHGETRVNEESQKQWGANPQYLELDQLNKLERLFSTNEAMQ
jgi:hypothetical protein